MLLGKVFDQAINGVGTKISVHKRCRVKIIWGGYRLWLGKAPVGRLLMHTWCALGVV